MVDGICGYSRCFKAPPAACAQGAIVLAMFLASDCLPGRPKIDGQYQFEVAEAAERQETCTGTCQEFWLVIELQDFLLKMELPMLAVYSALVKTGTPPPPTSISSGQGWLADMPVTQSDLPLVQKNLRRWKQRSSCSLSCLRELILQQLLPPFSMLISNLITYPEF